MAKTYSKSRSRKAYKKKRRVFKRKARRVPRSIPQDTLSMKVSLKKPILYNAAREAIIFVFPWCKFTNPFTPLNLQAMSVGLEEFPEFTAIRGQFQHMKVTYAKCELNIANIDLATTFTAYYENEKATNLDAIWGPDDVTSAQMVRKRDY